MVANICTYIKKIREIRGMKKNGVATRCRKSGVCNEKRIPEVVISLTSHPGRIMFVHRTIITLLNQTVKPDYIILWLAEEQFPDKEQSLPKELLGLKKYGLEIKWCNDIRSYKKLIPTLKLFPNAIIVTVDDDLYYYNNMLEELLNEHAKYPNDIISNMINPTYFNGEYFTVYDDKNKFYGTSSYYNKLIGCGGVIYPPNSLHEDIFNVDLFMEIAPTNDDMWFWAMAVKKHTLIRCPLNPVVPYAVTEPDIQSSTALWAYNNEDNRYNRCMIKILRTYPEILSIIGEK